MTPLRVAIVDDEEPARAALRVILSERPDVEIVAECRNGEEAVEVLGWVPIDVLFLDVQMPGLDGFQVVHAIGPRRMPVTVFVTAHDAFALRAFDVEAIDYVLKPFDRTRLLAALDRARRRLAERQSADWARRLVEATRDRTPPAPPVPRARLPVPTADRIVFVPLDEIDWIEAGDQYVMVHAGARTLTMRQSLQSLLARLPPGRFAQIHRSHAVNVAKVKEVVRLPRGDAEVVLASRSTPLRLSRRYRDDLRRRFDWPL
jgi:two-component system, LytTR family, response regulator